MSSAAEITFGKPFHFTTNTALNTFTFDQDADKVAWIFQAKEAATLSRLGISYASKTGTPNNFKLSLQGVDGSGLPDGSIIGSGTAKCTFTPQGLSWSNNTFNWINFDSSATVAVTRGQYLAMVLEVETTNSGTMVINGTFTGFVIGGFPYTNFANNVAFSSGTKQSAAPVFGYGSATKAYGTPIQSTTTGGTNVASNPDERAIVWTVPANWGIKTYTVRGIRLPCVATAANVQRFQLYQGTTVLASLAAADSDIVFATGSAGMQYFYFQDTTLPTLVAGVEYSIGSHGTTGGYSHYIFSVASAADMEAFDGYPYVKYQTRVDDGAWDTSASTTTRLLAEIIIETISGPQSQHPTHRVSL